MLRLYRPTQSLIDFTRSVELVAGYPRIEEGPALKAVEKGRSVTLTCTAVGYPQPEVVWLKDSIPLKMDEERIRVISQIIFFHN